MSTRRRVWIHLGMACIAVGFVAAAWTTRIKPTPLPAEFLAAKRPVSSQFVDDSKCVACHPEIAASLARSGMGTAFNTWKNAEPIEDRTEGPGPVLSLGDLNYQVIIANGRMFQREFRVVDGVEVELNRREAIYALGSGMKGRGYLASVGGHLTALPISWYSQRKAWDFSPGYRKANLRFDRPIRIECMACHDSAVGVLPNSTNGFIEPLPAGLGCQRCHGPGAEHVAFQESGGGAGDPMPNIKKLEPRLQNDVCLQCHLLSDDVVTRGDCSVFRPGDRLSDCRVNYFNLDKANAFDAVGHGPRSMASKCYTASGGKMTCIRCHDPHLPAREVPRSVYNGRCIECHEQVECKRTLQANETPRQGDCVSCHMPSRKSEDIPHTSSTEHWIQVPGRASGSPFPPPKDKSAKVVATTEGATPIENAIAELRRVAKMGASDECRRATVELENLLKKSTSPSGSAWLEAAKGFLVLDDLPKAKESVGRSLAADPTDVSAMELYAHLLGRIGDFASKAEVIEKILKANPWYNRGDVELLGALSRTGAERRAFELYDRYLQFHPPNVEALVMLGDMKRRTKAPNHEAGAYYNKAAFADGARFEPHLALARLATVEGDHADAAEHANAAALRNPNDAAIWSFAAACRWRAGDRAAAKNAAENSLALDPQNADARRVLRDWETSSARKP